MERKTAPLAGLRIVEVSAFVAAPLGVMTVGQLGAEVIRIDPIGGNIDYNRWPLAPNGNSIYWASLSKGKKFFTNSRPRRDTSTNDNQDIRRQGQKKYAATVIRGRSSFGTNMDP